MDRFLFLLTAPAQPPDLQAPSADLTVSCVNSSWLKKVRACMLGCTSSSDWSELGQSRCLGSDMCANKPTQSYQFQPDYAAALQRMFQAEAHPLTTTNAINRWVATATRDKITSILDSILPEVSEQMIPCLNSFTSCCKLAAFCIVCHGLLAHSELTCGSLVPADSVGAG